MADRANRIRVSLSLDDSAFNSALNSVRDRARNVFNNLGGIASNAVGSGALGVAGWLTGFGIVERAGMAAFDGIKNQIKAAVDLQTELIGAATSYQGLLNLNFGEARKLSREVASANARIAIGLPFEDFGKMLRAALGDDMLGALYNASDVAGSIEKSANILSRLQVLIGGTSGVNMGQQIGLVNDLLAGNYKKITGQEAYRNNPIFSRTFEKIVSDLGGEKQFNALSKQARITNIIEPLSKAISDDALGAYTKTVSGYVGKINNELIGIDGVFSLSRDLVFKLADTSLIDSLTALLGEIAALVNNLSPVIRGIVDPLAIALKTLIDGMTFILKPINAVLSFLGLLEPAIYALSAALATLFYVGLARIGIGGLAGLGGARAAAGAGGAATGLLSIFAGIGYNPLFGLVSVLQTLIGVLRAIVPAAFPAGLGALFQLLAGLAPIISFFPKILNFLGGAIALIASLGSSLLKSPLFWIPASIAGLATTIYQNWDNIGTWFKNLFDGILEGINKVLSKFSFLGDFASGVGDGFASVFDGIGNGFNKLGDGFNAAKDKIGKLFNGDRGTDSGSAFSPPRSQGNPLFDLLRNVSGGFLNFADGNVGIFDALVRERQSMPAGASPAIANSSEMILNRNQQSNLASAFSDRGSGRSITLNYSPTYNIPNNVDEEAIAQISMRSLNEWWMKTQAEYAY